MKKIDNSTMGGRIKEQRIKAGMTQEQLAEMMCTTKAAISQYENNKVDIKGSVIVEIAGILDTTAGYLLNNEVSVGDVATELVQLQEGNDYLNNISTMLAECGEDEIERLVQVMKLFLKK